MVVHKYAKGANAERELAKLLKSFGFGVIRSARSGGTISVPDIVGIKSGTILAFECKTWKKKPNLKKDEYLEFLDWVKRSGAHGYLAWRKRGKWKFLDIKEVKTKDIEKNGIKFEDLINDLHI